MKAPDLPLRAAARDQKEKAEDDEYVTCTLHHFSFVSSSFGRENNLILVE